MEATATWVEDEIYDRRQRQPATTCRPARSPNRPGRSTRFRRGCALRRLDLLPLPHRAVPDAEGGLPRIVRGMWRLADGAAGATDRYSMPGGRAGAHRARTRHARRQLRRCSRPPTVRPSASYDEGAALPGVAGSTDRARSAGSRAAAPHRVRRPPRQRHRALRARPGCWRVQLRAAPRPAARPAPRCRRPSTAPRVARDQRRPAVVDAATRSATVDFGARTVQYVEVTLVNAGIALPRAGAGPSTGYSCQGPSPQDDDLASSARERLR